MKPYGQDHESSNVRISPDKADIAHLGLSSKHGKQRSKSKRTTRRYWKRKVRTFFKNLLRKEKEEVY